MEFSISFKTGRKKDQVLNPVMPPDVYGNSNFYPLALSQNYQNKKALESMYNDLPEVQIAVNYIADTMPIIPFSHVKLRGGKYREVENSEVIQIIKNPNQYQSYNDLVRQWFINKLVLGASFLNPIKSVGFSTPSQLYVLPTSGVEIKEKKRSNIDLRLNEIEGYTVDFGNGKIFIPKVEIIAEYESSLSKKYTDYRSRLMSAILTSQSLRANYEARVKIYKDRGALGIISPSDTMVSIDKEASKKLKEQYLQNTGITGDKVPFLATSIPVSYTQIGFNVDDLKLNETKLQDFQTICGVFGIDTALFDNSRGTYNNKVLAKKNFWEDVAIPQFNGFLALLKRAFNMPENEYLLADYSDIPSLQEDYEKKVNANSKAWNDGVTTEAEYREAIGYEGGEKKTKPQLERDRNNPTGETNNDEPENQ